jgi:diguanylate cyclase
MSSAMARRFTIPLPQSATCRRLDRTRQATRVAKAKRSLMDGWRRLVERHVLPPVPLRIADALEIAQYERINRQMPVLYGSLVMSAIAAAVAAQGDFPAFFQYVIQPMLILFCIVRMTQWHRRRNQPVTLAEARDHCRRGVRISILVCLPVLCWTVAAYYETDPIARAIVPTFMVLGCIGAANCMAAHPHSAAVPLFAGVFPLAMMLLFSGETHSIGVGLAMMTVLVLQSRLILAGHSEFVRSLTLQHDMQQLAQTDPLTGLANRRALFDALTEAMRLPEAQSRPGVAMLDLDRFKPVNDRFGHAAGDQLLVEVAQRLKRVCRNEAMVARLGGDEFAILIRRNATAERLDAISTALLASLAEPIRLDEGVAVIGASIGSAIRHTETTLPSMLLAEADAALYAAKERSKSPEPAAIPAFRKAV